MQKTIYLLCLIFVSCAKPSEVNFQILGNSEVGQLTAFQNLSINCGNYMWNFGDGDIISDTINPKHIYQKPGTYTVRLDASGNQGKTFVTKEINVVGTSYSFKNELNFDLPNFNTFTSDNGFVNFIRHGTLISGHETDTVFTGRNEVMFEYMIEKEQYMGQIHYSLIKGSHNTFIINEQTPVRL